MLIDIKTISRSTGASMTFEAEISTEELVFSFQGYRLTRPLWIQGLLTNTGEGIFTLTGRIKTAYTGECARCLNPVPCELDLLLTEAFQSAAAKVTEGQIDSYRYSGNTVDINQAILDNLLTAMPQRLLCKEDCPGLCPECGASLNEKDCGCAVAQKGKASPFNQLKKLL